MKPKRYISEMLNDFEKRFRACGKNEIADEMVRTHNAYLCGIITELDAIGRVAAFASELK